MIVAKRIDADVLKVLLRSAVCEGNTVRITETLDRKLYLRVNQVLEALGAKWNRRAKAHIFTPFDLAEQAFAAMIIGDAVTAGEYVDAAKEYQFFETPKAVTDVLLVAAAIEHGMSVLEPSAGLGALAREAREVGGNVKCVESNEKMADELTKQDFVVACCDFLILDVSLPGYSAVVATRLPQWVDSRVDRVLMNPPFSRSRDIFHVESAWKWLKPGGRLVAVMGIGWTFRMDRTAVRFREFMVETGGQKCYLPEGSFASSGTQVSTVYVVINKPANADEVAEQ